MKINIMNLTELSLRRPIAIVSVIFMTIVMGFIALDRIPIQATRCKQTCNQYYYLLVWSFSL